jgi:hypothetical protein
MVRIGERMEAGFRPVERALYPERAPRALDSWKALVFQALAASGREACPLH